MSKFKIAKQIVNNNENCRNGCGFGCLIYFLSGAISSLICFIIEHINHFPCPNLATVKRMSGNSSERHYLGIYTFFVLKM